MDMKIRRKYILPLVLLLCVVAFAGCDTYYYGLKKTSHRSKVNREKTMYVHKSTVNGILQYSTSRAAKPAGMYKQRKVK
jgi:hypothetical protein